jgi:hypothetical protein
MTSENPPTEELIARTDEYHYLGTDTDGRDHYQDAILSVVWVTDDNNIVHIQRTADVDSWVEFIATNFGWDDLQYSNTSTTEWLTNTLAEAL